MTHPTDIAFVFEKTLTELEQDEERPCAYCNPDELVEERLESARSRHGEDVPKEAGLYMAEYVIQFGHVENGQGVEVPVCDTCLNGVPVDVENIVETLDIEYMGDGTVGQNVVETENGTEIHRRAPIPIDD